MHQSNHNDQPKLIVDDILEEPAMGIIEWQQRNIDLKALPSAHLVVRQGELVDYLKLETEHSAQWRPG